MFSPHEDVKDVFTISSRSKHPQLTVWETSSQVATAARKIVSSSLKSHLSAPDPWKLYCVDTPTCWTWNPFLTPKDLVLTCFEVVSYSFFFLQLVMLECSVQFPGWSFHHVWSNWQPRKQDLAPLHSAQARFNPRPRSHKNFLIGCNYWWLWKTILGMIGWDDTYFWDGLKPSMSFDRRYWIPGCDDYSWPSALRVTSPTLAAVLCRLIGGIDVVMKSNENHGL